MLCAPHAPFPSPFRERWGTRVVSPSALVSRKVRIPPPPAERTDKTGLLHVQCVIDVGIPASIEARISPRCLCAGDLLCGGFALGFLSLPGSLPQISLLFFFDLLLHLVIILQGPDPLRTLNLLPVQPLQDKTMSQTQRPISGRGRNK